MGAHSIFGTLAPGNLSLFYSYFYTAFELCVCEHISVVLFDVRAHPWLNLVRFFTLLFRWLVSNQSYRQLPTHTVVLVERKNKFEFR